VFSLFYNTVCSCRCCVCHCFDARFCRPVVGSATRRKGKVGLFTAVSGETSSTTASAATPVPTLCHRSTCDVFSRAKTTQLTTKIHRSTPYLCLCYPAVVEYATGIYVYNYILQIIYTVSQKTVQNCFCHNFVKFPPTSIIFGTLIAERIHLCDVHLFSTSLNSRQRPTVVPNCYITL